MSVLTDKEINQWREQGYVLVQLPDHIWQDCKNVADDIFPKNRPEDFVDDFGGIGTKYDTSFPTKNFTINMLALNEDLLKIAQTLLKTDDIRLTQSELWCKYNTDTIASAKKTKLTNSNQRIHMDYGNHTWVHPSKWEDPDILSCILYYDDSDICDGGTAVVPRQGQNDPAYAWPYTKQIGYGKHMQYLNDRETCENYFKENDPELYEFRKQLYEREVHAKFKPGTILLYRHDIWHRGRPIIPGTSRRVHNLVYRRADRERILQWNVGFGWKNYSGYLEKVITLASPMQRQAIFFPKVGDKYWEDEDNVTAVYARYPGIDLGPYLKK